MNWRSWRTRAGLAVLRALAPLPQPCFNAAGAWLGRLLYWLAKPRRQVTLRNLELCFPALSRAQREQLARRHFEAFARSFLDRAWLWHGSTRSLERRLRIIGPLDRLHGDEAPVLMFAPHFVGLDAGWTALTLRSHEPLATLYIHQQNRLVDQWIRAGRERFGQPTVLTRHEGAKGMLRALKTGMPVYLLPDMDHGERDAVFARFFGVRAATLTSLPRLARLAGARVVPVITRMTPQGYDIEIGEPWADYPTGDAEADAQRMNHELERLVLTMPEQYYWVHKRFKTRPPGEPRLY